MATADRQMKLFIHRIHLPQYTEEEVQLLKTIIEGSNTTGFLGFRFTEGPVLKEFNNYANHNLELKYFLLIPFDRIPLINLEGVDQTTSAWKSGIIKWRLQIGK